MQDPATYLKELNIELAGFLDNSKPALLDSLRRTFVNYEAFFFSDAEHKYTFDENIARYCGRITDPVTLEQFAPGEKSPHISYANREFFFVSDSTLGAFQEMPEMYTLPAYKMRQETD